MPATAPSASPSDATLSAVGPVVEAWRARPDNLTINNALADALDALLDAWDAMEKKA